MADMFGRSVSSANPWCCEQAMLTFMSAGLTGGTVPVPVGDAMVSLLVTNLSIQYQQQISRIWEIGTYNQYFIEGRTAGNLQMGSVMGPKMGADLFFTAFGNVCNVKSNSIIFVSGINSCGGSQAVNLITCSGVVLTNVGFRLAAQEMIVNQDLGAMFASCSVDLGAASAVAAAV